MNKKFIPIIRCAAFLMIPLYLLGSILLGTRTFCVIKNLSGVPCPACGMGRAMFSLAKLNVGKAFYYHPLVFLLPVMVLLFTKTGILKKRSQNIIWNIIALIFAAVFVIRMVNYFPDTAPMDLSRNSVILRILGRN